MDSQLIRFGSLARPLSVETAVPACLASEGIHQRGYAHTPGFDDTSKIALPHPRVALKSLPKRGALHGAQCNTVDSHNGWLRL